VLNVVFRGTRKIKVKRLEKEVKTKPNAALDERQVKEDSEKKSGTIHPKGGLITRFRLRNVVQRDRNTGLPGRVHFQDSGGQQGQDRRRPVCRQRAHSGKNGSAPNGHEAVVDLFRLTDSGHFKDETLRVDDDLGKLRDYYRDNGYLDVEVPEARWYCRYPGGTG